jgi:UDP-N-acetylglucosamine:LPS N-acetylglucosamine transferase
MRTVLILTASFGEGHNAAARGLCEGFASLENVHAVLADPLESAFGKLYQRLRKDYVRIVNQRPGLWASLYAAADCFPFLNGILRLLWPLKAELVALLRKHHPAVVVSVYPAYGYVLKQAAREAGLLGLKSYVLVTDSITVNSIWYQCGADAFFVPNDDTANVLYKRGIERNRVVVTGFPVSLRYSEQGVQRQPPEQCCRPKVLYMINGQRGRASALVERLLREDKVDLTITVGRDEALSEELMGLGQRMRKPLNVLGWVDNVPELLRSHHILIGKAGGATVQETLAACTPMIITQILPGQEEGNARLLLQNGCAASCPTNEAVVTVLSDLFAKNAEAWHRMYRHTCALSRPDAARTIAKWVCERTESAETTEAQGFGVRPKLP